MTCNEARALVHAYVDGEVDVVRSLEVERHLAGCAECRALYEAQRSLADGVRATRAYYPAPADLRKRVRSSIRQEDRKEQPSGRLRWTWLLPVAVLLLALVAWAALRGQQARLLAGAEQNDVVAQEVLASSMRSLIAGPLTGVVSSDQHTVKPWFAGKLDYSPGVQDFASQGFPLAGGRLDYAAGRPVAALVYRHGQHVINLYEWPSSGGDVPLQETTVQGYRVFHWAQGGMAYWAVSDMDAAELRQFALLVQQGG